MQYKILINLQTTPFGNAGKSQILYNVLTYTPCNIILNVAAPIFRCEQTVMQAVLVVLITLPYCKKQNKNKNSCIPLAKIRHFRQSETLHSSTNAELKKV